MRRSQLAVRSLARSLARRQAALHLQLSRLCQIGFGSLPPARPLACMAARKRDGGGGHGQMARCGSAPADLMGANWQHGQMSIVRQLVGRQLRGDNKQACRVSPLAIASTAHSVSWIYELVRERGNYRTAKVHFRRKRARF